MDTSGFSILESSYYSPMQIANPIYDVVFKYLLEDNKIAKKLISLIIGEEIQSLTFKPTERRGSIESHSLSVFHLDFAATILQKNGQQKQVVIELQKAKISADIMRFRRYIGSQYTDPNHLDEQGKPLPILSIYILGHKLDHTNAPVIHVARTYTDQATGEILKEKEPFIETLTHDSFVIQLSCLKEHRRNLLEKVLHMFGETQTDFKQQMLDIDESDYPKDYKDLIRRLQKAIAEPEVRETMDIEDDWLEELCRMEREADAHQKRAEMAEQRAEESDRRVEESDRRAEEDRRQIEEERRQKEKLWSGMKSAYEQLIKSGMPKNEALKILSLKEAP
jgi:hypothetical protein